MAKLGGGFHASLTLLAQFSLACELLQTGQWVRSTLITDRVTRLAVERGENMRLWHLFTEHPSSLGETYPEHMRASLSYAVPLLGASLAAFVHAVFPFLFTTTASASVKRLYERMRRRCATCPSGRVHRPDLFVLGPAVKSYQTD